MAAFINQPFLRELFPSMGLNLWNSVLVCETRYATTLTQALTSIVCSELCVVKIVLLVGFSFPSSTIIFLEEAILLFWLVNNKLNTADGRVTVFSTNFHGEFHLFIFNSAPNINLWAANSNYLKLNWNPIKHNKRESGLI